MKTPLPKRLIYGARLLGKLWRQNVRCSSGWSLGCGEAPEAQTEFCRAKQFWVELAMKDGRECAGEDDPFFVVLLMKASEFNATQLTMTVDHPEHGRLRIGPKGELKLHEIATLVENPEAVSGVLKILSVFPNARVLGSESPTNNTAATAGKA